jgi:hypothetical protein
VTAKTAPPPPRVLVSASGVRQIPRLCPCDWELRYEDGKAAGWVLAARNPHCGMHQEERA